MTDVVLHRLFGLRDAFDHPVTLGISVGVLAAIILTPLVTISLSAAGLIGPRLREEIHRRTRSWAILIPLIGGPVLLGAAWTILAVSVLSILCYREFARVTGLFRERLLSAIVAGGILAISFAVFDHWYDLFVALAPLTVAMLAAVAVLQDQPRGYIQRVGLGVLALALFGSGLGHVGYFANDSLYRPMLLMLVAGVQFNDVFAFVVGKSMGQRKLAPNTSPNKTLAGSLGALVLTTGLVAALGHWVFRGGSLDRPWHLVNMGLLVSVGGQMGDLMLSSIKRDVGVKDTGTILPGHGGILDRFNSLLLAGPCVFHYIGYFRGIGFDQPPRILSGL